MKKILLIILTFAYLTSTSGATIYFQQCMGKTIGWSILEKKTDKCDKCGMHDNSPKNCCTGNVKVLKVHNDQNLPKLYSANIFASFAILPATIYFSKDLYVRSQVERSSFSSRPPPNVAFRVLYCTFII